MRSRTVIAPAVVLALLLSACGGDGGGPEGVPLDSGVRGQVTVGPGCPVEQEDATPCPDRPLQVAITVLDEDGDEVLTFETGEDGRFSANLRPGSYRLVPREPNPGAPPTAPELTSVEVNEGTYTEVAIVFDSGIR